MAKTKLTEKLEREIWKTICKMGTFGCFEVTIGLGWTGNQRVDFLSYSTDGTWRCFEIKVEIMSVGVSKLSTNDETYVSRMENVDNITLEVTFAFLGLTYYLKHYRMLMEETLNAGFKLQHAHTLFVTDTLWTANPEDKARGCRERLENLKQLEPEALELDEQLLNGELSDQLFNRVVDWYNRLHSNDPELKITL